MKNKKEELEEKEPEIINIPLEELDLSDAENLDPHLDSKEEHYFAHYLLELKEHGVILDADKNLMSIQIGDPIKHHYTEIMKTKTKIGIQFLSKKASYKPDFNCRWSPDWKDIIFANINQGKKLKGQVVPFITCNGMLMGSTFEIKADFTQANKLALTNLRILWLYEKEQYFVQMLKIPKLFKETFTPKAFMDDHIYKVNSAGGKKGTSRLKYKVVTCEEYLRKIKEEAAGQTVIM